MKERVFKIADNLNLFSIYALIFFIPISKAAIEIFFTLAWFSFLVKKFCSHEFKFLKRRENIFLLFFIGFCALSLLNSNEYFSKSFTALFFKWSKNILIFLMAQDALNGRRRFRNALFILLGISTVVGIDAILQHFWGIEIFTFTRNVLPQGSLNYATASFYHYNDLGAYLLAPICIVLAFIVSKKPSRKFLFLLLTQALIFIFAIIFTYSRGTWLGLSVALFLMLFLSKRFKLILITFFFFISIIIIMPQVRERAIFAFTRFNETGRFPIWKNALLMVRDNPFLGKGIGTFMDHYPQYSGQNEALYAHNCFLQIWAETGTFSLISFLAFLIVVLRRAFIKFKDESNYALLGLTCATSAFLVHSFFDTQLYSLQLSAFFWLLLALLNVSTIQRIEFSNNNP